MKLLSIVISVFFSLAVAEILLRATSYRPAIMDPNMYVAHSNPLLPYELRPNYDGYCGGSQVRTDADGNRVVSPDYGSLYAGLAERPNRTILILGDSGVFGFGLADADTIASQLQSTCGKQNLNYEIRNIGVPGYTSWNEYAAFANYLERYPVTDMVLLYMPNDLTLDNDYFGIGRGSYASYSKNEDRWHRFLRGLYTQVYVANLLSDGLKRLAGVTNKQEPSAAEKFDAARVQRQIDYSMEALRRIQDICKKRSVRFSVAIYRDVAYYSDAGNCLSYEQAIKSNLDRAGIHSFFAKSHIDKLTAGEVRVHLNDPHPSKKAVTLIVEDILNELGR